MDPELLTIVICIVASYVIIRVIKNSFIGKLLSAVISLLFLLLIIYVMTVIYSFLK